jgi:hypothetical protein
MAAPSVDDLARSFERYLRAGNKSPRTIETDLEAVRGFAAHLAGTSGRARPARPGTDRAATPRLQGRRGARGGKGGRERALPYGRKTARALDATCVLGRDTGSPTWTCCG